MNIFRKIRPLNQFLRRVSYMKGSGIQAADVLDPGVEVTILHNGVRVATEWKPSPITCVTLYVEVGSRYESSRNHGITHFIEHLAYKDYKYLRQYQLECILTSEGASMWVETERDMQKFSALCPNYLVPKIIDILSKTVTEIDVSDYAVENEKRKIYLELIDHDSDPRNVVFDYLHQAAFQGTPLAKRVMGPTKNIQNFDGRMATEYIYQQYQPYKFCISVSGQVDHEMIVRYAEATFGRMCYDPSFESVEGPTRYCGSKIMFRDDSMPHAHVAIAYEAPGYGGRDYDVLYVAKNMIGNWHKSQGGKDGIGSPLARAASVSGLAESIEPFYITYRDVGLWGVYFVADRMHLDDMIGNIQDLTLKMCHMMQTTDVEFGRNMAQLDLAKNVEGTWRSAHDIGRQMLLTCTRRSLADACKAMCTVQVESMHETCDKMFNDKCPVVIGVGPTENLFDYSRIRGGQYWLRV